MGPARPASEDPLRSQYETLQETMLPEGDKRVLGTRGSEAAAGREQWRDGHLVKANEKDRRIQGQSLQVSQYLPHAIRCIPSCSWLRVS